MYYFNPQLHRALESQLNSGETVRWAGQPIVKAFGKRSIIQMLFGLAWTGFAIFWVATAFNFTTPDTEDFTAFKVEYFFGIFGLPFIAVGIWLASAPLREPKKAARTIFVISNERVFQLYVGKKLRVKQYQTIQMDAIEKTEAHDGSGSLYFDRQQIRTKHGYRTIRTGFHNIKDVRAAENALRKLLQDRPRNL